ncbi:MAG: S41 family peptidase [Siphonobacter sp.]
MTTSSPDSETINEWIYEQMSSYYYWSDQVPAESSTDKTLDPSDYFNSLLYTYNSVSNPTGDRFSYICEDGSAMEAALNGQTQSTGIQYRLFYLDNGNTNVAGQVLYVLAGSPAEKAGFQRGNIFTKVNGESLTTTNYSSLLANSSLTFTLAELSSSNTLVDTQNTISVTTTTIQENPVFLDSIYTVNSKKVGYLVYNQFIPGPNGSSAEEYDNQLRTIFGTFKSAGIESLILDLRYNTGGSISSAITLASLIAKVTGNKQVFYKEGYNSQMNIYITKNYGTDYFNEYFTEETNSLGDQISKVTILTSQWTASTSELLINGLKPYMTVKLIGETTYGMNVATTTLVDDTGAISYGLQPVLMKVYNSVGQSDYASGFTPDQQVSEPIDLQPLGSTQEALLKVALQVVATGGRTSATTMQQLSGSKSGILGKMTVPEKIKAVFVEKKTI